MNHNEKKEAEDETLLMAREVEENENGYWGKLKNSDIVVGEGKKEAKAEENCLLWLTNI